MVPLQKVEWEMGSPQPSQKVEMLLGFLGYVAGVEGTSEVLCNANTKEFCALDALHRGSIDVHWRVFS